MSIIVEGPDGAGKTTLIQDLQGHFPNMELHPRFCTSKGGPISELAEAVFRDQQRGPTHYIYDRHPVLSEYIYSTSIPGRSISEPFLSDVMGRIRARVARHSLVIFCLPPYDEVLKNVYADSTEQMDGVVTHIDRIYEQYQMHRIMWPGQCITFDYTKQDSSWEALRFALNASRNKLWKEQP